MVLCTRPSTVAPSAAATAGRFVPVGTRLSGLMRSLYTLYTGSPCGPFCARRRPPTAARASVRRPAGRPRAPAGAAERAFGRRERAKLKPPRFRRARTSCPTTGHADPPAGGGPPNGDLANGDGGGARPPAPAPAPAPAMGQASRPRLAHRARLPPQTAPHPSLPPPHPAPPHTHTPTPTPPRARALLRRRRRRARAGAHCTVVYQTPN